MSKAKEILDRTYVDVSIENLKRREQEIRNDLDSVLAPYLTPDEEYEEYDAGESEDAGDWYSEDDDVRLNWDYEEDEDWNDV